MGLATLPKGPGLAFDILKVFKILKINYGCFKTVKLVKKVIIVINRVPTNYLLRKKIRKTDFYYQNQLAWPTNLATSTVTINWILIKKSTKQLTMTYIEMRRFNRNIVQWTKKNIKSTKRNHWKPPKLGDYSHLKCTMS